jgi:hypothetical protein
VDYCPQVEQEPLLQVLQLLFPPLMTRPPLWAKKTEILREVCSPLHFLQRISASASLIERRASNSARQSWQ